jgi:phage tail-like protein
MVQSSTSRKDPYPEFKFYFGVEISGVLVAMFTECSGLESEREYETFYEGGANDHPNYRLKYVKYSPLTLKRGIAWDTALWDWYHTGHADGTADRRNITILAFDVAGTKKKSWDVYNAFPTKWTGPNFRSAGTDMAVESIQLAYERFEEHKSGS